MATPTFTYPRGAPIVFDRVVDDPGAYDPALLTATVRLKKANGQSAPRPGVPAIATLQTAFVPAAGGAKAYWRFTLADTHALAAGFYAADMELRLADQPIDVSEIVLIRVKDSVTPP